jgi:hypothetical protein
VKPIARRAHSRPEPQLDAAIEVKAGATLIVGHDAQIAGEPEPAGETTSPEAPPSETPLLILNGWISMFAWRTPMRQMYKATCEPQSSQVDVLYMITADQMRAARALLQIDQRQLAELSGLSLPTIQRMEASEGVIRGNIDSLSKLIAALNAAGVELIDEGAVSQNGGRGVRLSRRPG